MWDVYLRVSVCPENFLAAWKVPLSTLNPLQSPPLAFTTSCWTSRGRFPVALSQLH